MDHIIYIAFERQAKIVIYQERNANTQRNRKKLRAVQMHEKYSNLNCKL